MQAGVETCVLLKHSTDVLRLHAWPYFMYDGAVEQMQFNLGSPVQQIDIQGSHLGIERFAFGQKCAPSDPAQSTVCGGTVHWKCGGKMQGDALTFGDSDLTGAYYLSLWKFTLTGTTSYFKALAQLL